MGNKASVATQTSSAGAASSSVTQTSQQSQAAPPGKATQSAVSPLTQQILEPLEGSLAAALDKAAQPLVANVKTVFEDEVRAIEYTLAYSLLGAVGGYLLVTSAPVAGSLGGAALGLYMGIKQ